MLQEQGRAKAGYDIDGRTGQHQGVFLEGHLAHAVEQGVPFGPFLTGIPAFGAGFERHKVAGPLLAESFGGDPDAPAKGRVHDACLFGTELFEHDEMQVAPLGDDVEDGRFGKAVESCDVFFVGLVGGCLESDFPAGVEDTLDAGAGL